MVSTNSLVSKPKAFNRFVCSISSLLLKGVTAPKSCNSFIISFVLEREPVRTSRLFLCVSISAALTKINCAVLISANAAANFFIVPVKVLTLEEAPFPALPNLSKFFFPSFNLSFNLSVFLPCFVLLTI